ncbi:MAG: GNAT family N-acetyltransferase [Chloroflexota bacterium]
MQKFSLRPAVQQDASTIKQLIIAGRINPTGLDWMRFFVAETDGGEVIGCGQIKPHRDHSYELASIAVREDWRGRGVARKIIEDLMSNYGEAPLYLLCGSGVGKLYEKFGFRVLSIEEMPKYYRRVSKLVGWVQPLVDRGESLLIMGRD